MATCAVAAIMALALLLPHASAFGSTANSPSEVLADPDRFDGQSVTVSGTIVNVRDLGPTSFALELSDGQRSIRVLWFGPLGCGAGVAASADGVFRKTKREGYRIYSEVEATRIACH